MASWRKYVRLILVPAVFGLLGYGIGVAVGFFFITVPFSKATEVSFPFPHHIPKYPGNITLRFAMVQDVIHERFPRHGQDYYRARNHEVEQALKTKTATARGTVAGEYFQLLDDRGVGLEFLGQHRQAVDLMRDKLKQQENLGYEGRALYTTYANLGTFLVLWQLSEGVEDVPKAKERIGESVRWIRKAIAVYPQSHFGRESWQVVLEEFLLAVLDKPELLLRYDMIGDRLDQPIDVNAARCLDERKWLRRGDAEEAVYYLKRPDLRENMERFRYSVTRVGADEGWKDAVATAHPKPVPFDEPTLGIIGMWRMGAGANPHFSLCLGEIMLRVGQRYLAWAAYERTWMLRAHFWPDARLQEQLAAHCRARQQLIELSLPEEDWNARRRQFNQELEIGQKHQKEYQAYEARCIAAGASIDDAHFYDAFDAEHGSIASPVGPEKTYARYSGPSDPVGWGLVVGGLLACAAAWAQMVGAKASGGS